MKHTTNRQTHTQLRPPASEGFLLQEKTNDNFSSSPRVVGTEKDISFGETVRTSGNNTILRRGQVINRTSVSSSVYSTTMSDFLISVTSLTTGVTIGLPSPGLVRTGKTYVVKDEVGGAGTTTITIRSFGDSNIDGSVTTTITTNYGAKRLYSSGTEWFTY